MSTLNHIGWLLLASPIAAGLCWILFRMAKHLREAWIENDRVTLAATCVGVWIVVSCLLIQA